MIGRAAKILGNRATLRGIFAFREVLVFAAPGA
jgi:hypothetical protein